MLYHIRMSKKDDEKLWQNRCTDEHDVFDDFEAYEGRLSVLNEIDGRILCYYREIFKKFGTEQILKIYS